MKLDTSPPSKPHLLTLPPEIRAQIWAAVFTALPATTNTHTHASPLPCVALRYSPTAARHSSVLRALLTCRQVHAEAHGLFYAGNTLCCSTPAQLLHFLRQLSPRRRAPVASLCVAGFGGTHWSGAGAARQAFALLALCPRLRYLRVELGLELTAEIVHPPCVARVLKRRQALRMNRRYLGIPHAKYEQADEAVLATLKYGWLELRPGREGAEEGEEDSEVVDDDELDEDDVDEENDDPEDEHSGDDESVDHNTGGGDLWEPGDDSDSDYGDDRYGDDNEGHGVEDDATEHPAPEEHRAVIGASGGQWEEWWSALHTLRHLRGLDAAASGLWALDARADGLPLARGWSRLDAAAGLAEAARPGVRGVWARIASYGVLRPAAAEEDWIAVATRPVVGPWQAELRSAWGRQRPAGPSEGRLQRALKRKWAGPADAAAGGAEPSAGAGDGTGEGIRTLTAGESQLR